MSTKIGCKKDLNKPSTRMRRTPLRKVSKKQAAENTELRKLVSELRAKANNRSELTGEFCLWLDPHHLGGRGRNLLNVFEIIMVSRAEHLIEQKHMSFTHKEELRAKVRVIRLAQGYKEEDYQ